MPIALPVDTSGIGPPNEIIGSEITLPISQLKTHLEDTLNGEQPFEQLNLGAATELTISGGVITITGSHHRVDTESNASTDDLDTISGGAEGDLLLLRLENAARVVVVKHDTGNIFLAGGSDVTLNSVNKGLLLGFNGNKWMDVGGSGGGSALPLTTKGDLLGHDGSVPVRLPVSGNNGYVLTEDSTAANGVKWAAPASRMIYRGSGLSISSSAAITSILTAALGGTLTIPGSTLKTGDVIRITASGLISTAGAAGNFTIRVSAGSTVAASPTQAITNSVASRYWKFMAEIYIGTVGVSTGISIDGALIFNSTSGVANAYWGIPGVVANFNSTNPLTLDVDIQWGTSSGSNIFAVTSSYIELLSVGSI